MGNDERKNKYLIISIDVEEKDYLKDTMKESVK